MKGKGDSKWDGPNNTCLAVKQNCFLEQLKVLALWGYVWWEVERLRAKEWKMKWKWLVGARL